MKVFTHYTKITEQEEFRWRTLLQFGESWDIMGQRRSSVAGLTEDDRQTVDKERQVGDPMQLRTEVLNL